MLSFSKQYLQFLRAQEDDNFLRDNHFQTMNSLMLLVSKL